MRGYVFDSTAPIATITHERTTVRLKQLFDICVRHVYGAYPSTVNVPSRISDDRASMEGVGEKSECGSKYSLV